MFQFRETGKLMYGDEVVFEDVDFRCTNDDGSTSYGQVENKGEAKVMVTQAQHKKFFDLLKKSGPDVWRMAFSDGRSGSIIPLPPREEPNSPSFRITIPFRQNGLIK